jgi:hypothetical protein
MVAGAARRPSAMSTAPRRRVVMACSTPPRARRAMIGTLKMATAARRRAWRSPRGRGAPAEGKEAPTPATPHRRGRAVALADPEMEPKARPLAAVRARARPGRRTPAATRRLVRAPSTMVAAAPRAGRDAGSYGGCSCSSGWAPGIAGCVTADEQSHDRGSRGLSKLEADPNLSEPAAPLVEGAPPRPASPDESAET